MKILLIEDDQHSALRLSAILKQIDDSFQILTVCTSVKNSVEWLKNEDSPDLIFLDIQLSDGISFEIFDQVEISCPIIFVTAFNNYAEEAFKVNSIDYILKPYSSSDIKKSLVNFKTQKNVDRLKIDDQVILELKKLFTPNYKSRFFAKINHTVYSISANEILCFKYEDQATVLVNNENRSFIINYSLDSLQNHLNPKQFFRISRSYIINIDSIKKMNISSKSRIEVILLNNIKEYVSRAKTKDFKSWLDI